MKYVNCVILCFSLLFNSHLTYAKMPIAKSDKFIARYLSNLSNIDLKTIFINELKDKVSSQELSRLKNSKFAVKSSYRDNKHYLNWKINNRVLIDFSLDISKKEFVNQITKKVFPISSQEDLIIVKRDLVKNLKDFQIVDNKKINLYDLIFFSEAHAHPVGLILLLAIVIDLIITPLQHLYYWEASLIQWIERHLDFSDDFCCTFTNTFLENIKNEKLKTRTCEKSAAKLTERLVNFSNGDIKRISNDDGRELLKKAIRELKSNLSDLTPSSRSVFDDFFSEYFYSDKLEDLLDPEQVIKSLHSMFKNCDKNSFLVKTGEDWNFYSLYDTILGANEIDSKKMPTIEIENSLECRTFYSSKKEEVNKGLIAMSRDFACNEKLNSTFEEYRQSVIQIEKKSPNKSVNWSARSIKQRTEDFIKWTNALSRPSATGK